jgi:hypothetical protein
VLAYGEWVEQCVLRPVPHRQYVFTVPKLIRPFFAYRRSLLGELRRIIARALTQAYGAALPRARPGFILFVQTFGDLVNFNSHVHALVADGVFEALDASFLCRRSRKRFSASGCAARCWASSFEEKRSCRR